MLVLKLSGFLMTDDLKAQLKYIYFTNINFITVFKYFFTSKPLMIYST